MTKKNITAAAQKATENNENMMLWQAAIQMEEYGLITYQQLRDIEKALIAARKAA